MSELRIDVSERLLKQLEEHQLHQLSVALKQQLLKEIRDDQNANGTRQ
jgi:hypothetical protein